MGPGGPGAAPPSPMVRGPRRAAAVAGVWARVAWIALRTYGNPLRAARALRRIRAERWPARGEGRAERRPRTWTSQKCVEGAGRLFWDLYAPGWPSPAFDRCIERELERVDPVGRPPSLQTAVVAVTRRCPLRCGHCVEADALGSDEALSAPDLHAIVARLRTLGPSQILFSGGEPMQRFEDLVALAASASAASDVWVVTSGQGLTAGRAARLRRAGVTGVCLSLDHWDPERHDRFRGRAGAFAAAVRAAGHAREAGLVLALWLCPTREFTTAENLRRYGETARSLGAGFIQVMEPRAAGGWAGRDVALLPAQRRLLEEFAERLGGDPAARDLPSVRYVDAEARAEGCSGAGDRFAYVDTKGELHPCPFCRAPGLRVLEEGFASALSKVRGAGCPARAGDVALAGRR